MGAKAIIVDLCGVITYRVLRVMIEKKQINVGAVEETLFIPLLMRWKDAESPKPILGDRVALDIAQQMDFNWEKYGGWNKMSYYGCLVRAKYCDQEVVTLAKTPVPDTLLLVNAGCGLDTRWHRTIQTLSSYRRIDLDLEPVISLRNEVMPPLDGVQSLAGDLTSPNFITELQSLTTAETQVILVIEGVLMYFTDREIRELMDRLYGAFGDRLLIVCDMLNSTVVKHQKQHDTIRHSEACFRSGYDSIAEVEGLHPHLRVLHRRSVLDMMKPYTFIARIGALIPSLRWNTTIYTLDFKKA